MASAPMTATRLGHTSWIVDDDQKALTAATRNVLCALAHALDREGTASLREIMRLAGLRSPSSVTHHLRKLARHGYIDPLVHDRPRGWQLTDRGRAEVPPA